ncbi:hypothetical protein EDD73_11965 [Heliophilum fasciatum]|uniref:Uncharacterized protein n=1 Tax=Heliophilum fasciatum TaxID=35700 RepID=A0A4R2RKJ5_9FIRM|nr:hypothetical protein [Heliophilum fasciatum]TCP62717.1 hypothetical protein EDD73_11965 [Heliophilum fasciatum]
MPVQIVGIQLFTMLLPLMSGLVYIDVRLVTIR